MRRLPFSWLLSLLLVFAQHGAVLHEVGHLSHLGHQSGASLTDLKAQDAGPCGACEAYGQVANPASGASLDIPVCIAAGAAIATPCASFLAADTLTPRSRGPPQV
jgi:hypothetical protein